MQNNQSDGGTRNSGPEDAHEFRVHESNSELQQLYVTRLKEVLVSLTIPELSRTSGVSDAAIRTYLSGRSLPGLEGAWKIARATGHTVDWFTPSLGKVSFAREAAATYEAGMQLERRLADFALIPLYDVRASAGHGAWNDEERVGKMLAFRRDWLHVQIGSNAENLALCYVDGDSMEPTVADGDVVMFDVQQRELRSDDIYVFEAADQLLIKRLQRVSAGRLRVISDNTRYPPYEMSPSEVGDDTFPIHIVGRVLWAGVRL